LNILKGYSEAVNGMADNTMAKKGKEKKRPNNDLQSTIKKTKD
jgi:hypothetical protein